VGSPGAEVHFSVMHVVHPKDGDTRQAAEAKTDENKGVFALMHHADSMLDRDNAQLDQVCLPSLRHALPPLRVCTLGLTQRGPAGEQKVC
jgi:hypothetical protein